MNQVHSPDATPSARRANAPKSHWGLLLLLFATPSQLSCKSKSLPLCTYQHTYSIYICIYIYIIYIKSEYVQLCEKKERKTHRFNFYARAHFDCCVLLLLLPLFTCFFLFLPASASSSRAPKKIKSVTKNCITHAKCWQGKSATVKNDTNTFISGIRRKSEECEIKYIYTLWLLNYSKTIYIYFCLSLHNLTTSTGFLFLESVRNS